MGKPMQRRVPAQFLPLRSPDRVVCRNSTYELFQLATALALPCTHEHHIHSPRVAFHVRNRFRTVNSRIVREREKLDPGIQGTYLGNIYFTSSKDVIVFRNSRTL